MIGPGPVTTGCGPWSAPSKARLALTVRGILEMLLVGLTLTTAYTLLVLMTMFAPSLCRRSSATWPLLATMLALGAWLLAPASWRIFPHPIYFTWLVSLATFFLVAVADGRRLESWTQEH